MENLAILTFNVGLMQFKICGIELYNNPPYIDERLKKIPDALKSSEADLICLQEVYGMQHKKYLIDLLQFEYPYAAFVHENKILGLDNGLLVLSKFKILKYNFVAFTNTTFTESLLGSKGVLIVTVEMLGSPNITLFNVHMVSGTFNPECKKLDELRLTEMHEVLKLADSVLKYGNQAIILGDFNAGPTVCGAAYNYLKHNGWKDAFITGQKLKMLSHKNECSYSNISTVEGTDNSTENQTYPMDFCSECESANSYHMKSKSNIYSIKNSVNTNYDQIFLNCLRDVQRFNIPRPKTVADLFKQKKSLNLELDDGYGWTWDPKNTLNASGPHADCHGVRCDHIFISPSTKNIYTAHTSKILFMNPVVKIKLKPPLLNPSRWCGVRDKNNETHVTISDHHGIFVILKKNNYTKDNTIILE